MKKYKTTIHFDGLEHIEEIGTRYVLRLGVSGFTRYIKSEDVYFDGVKSGKTFIGSRKYGPFETWQDGGELFVY